MGWRAAKARPIRPRTVAGTRGQGWVVRGSAARPSGQMAANPPAIERKTTVVTELGSIDPLVTR